jgi:large subunit ribosomal protein L10
MAVSKQQKKGILADLSEKIQKSKSIFFVRNLGLSVQDLQKMRSLLRKEGNMYRVAKKTLIKKAANEVSNIELPDSVLSGAVGVAFSVEDELSAIKIVANFSKTSDKIELVGGIFEGKVLSQEEVVALSQIPGKEELIAKFLGSLQAPLSGFVGVGNQLVSGFVRALDGYREQRLTSEKA